MKFDFGGYASRNDMLCSDGRIIRRDAFKEMDGKTVPIVFMHEHNNLDQVLGHALLENREDGLYCYGKLNEDLPQGARAKSMVEHGDINALSIYANQLTQDGNNVVHGTVREVSLVLAGANPGAMIDNLEIEHADGMVSTDASEGEIYSGLNFELGVEHADEPASSDDSSEEDGPTIQDVLDSMNEQQKDVLYYLVGQAAEGTTDDEGSEEEDGSMQQSAIEGNEMHHNVFDNAGYKNDGALVHDAFRNILHTAAAGKVESLRDLVSVEAGKNKELDNFLNHAAYDEASQVAGTNYGIANIEYLFPEYRNVDSQPRMIDRHTEWVSKIISGAHKTPFAKVRSTFADITADEARAKGYLKGHRKTEEVIKLLRRDTSPTTLYKKQKLDRDDILDITDFDVVAWLKVEMQGKLVEELARAILIGDGRAADSEDKIDEEKIRPIYKDTEDNFYAVQTTVSSSSTDENQKWIDYIDAISDAIAEEYEGTGTPAFYTTKHIHRQMKKVKDKMGRKIYASDADLCDDLGVSSIVDVDVMKGLKRASGSDKYDCLGIAVNVADYNIGTNAGGATTFFDDFDIDFNKYKYLYETRLSGALIAYHSAIVCEVKEASTSGTAGTGAGA